MKSSPSSHPQENTITQLKTLSRLLDEAIPIPGTSYHIGLDPLLSLIPAAGDYLSAILSGYIVVQSARLGVSREILIKMVVNILTDALVGTFPVFGDLFDFAWKANVRNLQLLEDHLQFPKTGTKADWKFLVLLLGALFLGVTVTVGLMIGIILWISSFLGNG